MDFLKKEYSLALLLLVAVVCFIAGMVLDEQFRKVI